jgi:hypothetical protein
MVLSTTAAFATNASASAARNYTTNRDPIDIGIADFNCDGHNDMAVATDGTHTITVLTNDGTGDFTDRYDVWVSGNTSRNAEWDEFSNVQFLEVGEFTGDSAPDIAIFQRNNPFKRDANGAPAGEPGNLTILENDGCSSDSFSIGARFTHFYAWDLAVGDVNQDGNDDVLVLDLLNDISNQRVVTYMGPVSSTTTPMTTALGASSTNAYRDLEVGDWGEGQQGLGSQCYDEDIWLLRSEGVDYTTGTVTNPGNDDNVTVIEFNCQTNLFPTTYTFSTTPQAGSHVVNMANTFGAFDIGDIDDNGVIDTIAMTQGNLENITYTTSSAVGTWATPTLAYFGPYISYDVTVADINGDGEPDFVNPTVAYQQNTSDSAGGSTSSFWLNFPTTVQVTLSDGSGGHVTPLSYEAGRRPNIAVVGQLAGSTTSAPDIVVGHTSYDFGSWIDNLGWDGQYDYVTLVEMDNKDIAVTDIEISPVDRYFGVVGEGTRSIDVTVTNTGMDTLTQSATLDVELKVVDESNSSNTTVYTDDFDSAADASGCGSGCTWVFNEYTDQSSMWHLETNHSVGATDGNNGPNLSANYLNPTDFMWAGEYKTNSSGDEWSGYGRHWDDALTLTDVDLTGSDRAFLSVELFRHLGYGALGSGVDTDGDGAADQFLVGDVWDDIAMVEVGSSETGWSTIACPTSAQVGGACLSGTSMWGGYDLDRLRTLNAGGAAENLLYYGLAAAGTYYGWSNFTEEGVGEFDLSPWAGETVDIRFRLRTGFEGSISDDNESLWSGRDGYAIDNITIYKQNTAYFPNPQTLQSNLNLVNLGPGEEETASITANLLNDTIYRISATLSNHAWDEQPVNDDIIEYVQPFNLYDPAIEGIDYFNPGGLYAEGFFDIDVINNNWGNTMVDYDIKATVFSATPSDVLCSAPAVICKESFEGGATGYVYSDDGNPQGAIYNEATCNDVIFNNNAYWFGHPCDTSTQGYGDLWENETLTIPGVDLTGMSGDFVSLNFEYYADTFYGIDVDGTSIVDVNDYASINVDYTKGSDTYSAVLLGQWNDYDEDGTCRNDDNEDGFVNASESINQAEISFIGDSASTDGSDGNYNVFFNTDDLILSRSIDLTHLYVLNNTAADSLQWSRECISLAGSTADINFEFQSDDDGRNGINDGFKGVAFNNITLQEFTFYEDASYTVSRTMVDAEEVATTTVANHEFFSGVYMIRAETIFDNATAGVPWFNDNEVSEANNFEQVIFNVESVDITLGKPSTLACLEDGVYACVLPIDGSLTHNWDLKATNGVLAGDYMFYMTVYDETDGAQVHQATSAPTTTALESNERIDLTFPAYNGWMDGHSYNISYHAELANGNPSGNIRYFHATFADQIDVAILSDSTARTSTIKEDLQLLGMSYTQFAINDWTTYLDSGWMTHYDKILLPWQEDVAAKDVESGGRGYYQKLGSTANRQTLESFMSAGGTVQAHLGPQGSQIYGLDVGLNGRLPFGMDVQSRNTPETKILYTGLDIADPFHPIMDDVSTTAFQGFEGDGTVATAVLNTNSVSTQNVPGVCNGYMEDGGFFQSLLRTSANNKDVIMGTCSYYQGGMIISTIDVATYSSRADSTTFPLLGNMLSYSVTPYPEGFGAMGQDLGLTIDDDVPGIDPSTGGYATHYMKSDATVAFGYNSATTATLTADWILDGPTNWMGQTMASGTDHISEAAPSATFCKTDLSSATGCLQGAQWTVTLLLHDDAGHARIISIVVETNDVLADAYAPEANMSIDMRDEYSDNIEYIGTKTVSNTEWDVNRVILTEAGELVLHFDASESFDADAIDPDNDKGIVTYEWKVFFDAPYGDTSFNLEGHTFEESAASNGLFSYKFQNVTVDDSGTAESQIRMELRVYDASGKFSDKFRMYFVVVPEGYGDEIPVVQYNDFENTSVGVSESTYTITGTILSGSETGEVYVEAAFSRDDFSASAIEKYNLITDNKFDRSEALADSESFELTLNIDEFYSNTSEVVEIWVRVYEGDDERWSDDLTKMVLINLKQCRGVLANESALAAGGDFVWNATTSECDWIGEWTYDPTAGTWSEPTTDNQGEDESDDSNLMLIVAIIASVLVLLLVSVFFLRSGSGDKIDNLSAAAAGYGQEMDMTEQYVQQLIAQGYPEETARAYAAQYVGQAAAAPAAAAPTAAAPAASNDLYTQYYNQYFQQFVSQGYDEATAAQYAQQYAAQAQQQQQ